MLECPGVRRNSTLPGVECGRRCLLGQAYARSVILKTSCIEYFGTDKRRPATYRICTNLHKLLEKPAQGKDMAGSSAFCAAITSASKV